MLLRLNLRDFILYCHTWLCESLIFIIFPLYSHSWPLPSCVDSW